MATIQGIYVALFGRPADPGGLAYWNGVTNNGSDLSKLIGQLTASQEYLDRFKGKTNAEIVTTIYQSLFGRAPDAGGLDFFTKGLANGTLKLETLAINILDGAQGSDKSIIDNKTAAADLFTKSLDTPAEIAAYNGNAAAELGRAFLTKITDDKTSIPNQTDVDKAVAGVVTPSGGQGPSEGGSTGGGGGGGGSLFPAATFDSGKLTIAATAQATYVANNDGTATISAASHSALTVKIADISDIVIKSNAKLNIPGSELEAKGYKVSGDGTLNATGVTFVQANAKTNDGNVDNVKFDASADIDPRLITSKFEVNGSVADGFKVAWDYVDDHYSYYNTSINSVGVKLGIAYFNFLKAGGTPLTDVIVKAEDSGRLQSMHDNLLGNLHEPSIKDKFFDSTGGGSNGGDNGTADNVLGQQMLNAVAAAGASDRPYYGGNVSENVNGGAGDLARAWDYAHGLNRTDYVEQSVNAKVDSSAIKAGNQLYFGAGNTVDGFNVVRHEGAGIEIALKAKERGGADYTGFKQSDGVVEYHVGSGNAGGNNSRAKWSFDFSVDTGLNGTNKNLGDFTFKAYVDIDKSAAVKYVELDMVKNSNGVTPWILKDSSPATGFGDEDGTNLNISQNSVNYGFNFLRSLIDNDSSTQEIEQYDYNSGTFDIKFEASGDNGVLLTNHIRVFVGDLV